MQMEQPTPSHVDTNQINFTSDEETDKEYIRVSGLKPPDLKKSRPSVQN